MTLCLQSSHPAPADPLFSWATPPLAFRRSRSQYSHGPSFAGWAPPGGSPLSSAISKPCNRRGEAQRYPFSNLFLLSPFVIFGIGAPGSQGWRWLLSALAHPARHAVSCAVSGKLHKMCVCDSVEWPVHQPRALLVGPVGESLCSLPITSLLLFPPVSACPSNFKIPRGPWGGHSHQYRCGLSPARTWRPQQGTCLVMGTVIEIYFIHCGCQ